MEKDRKWIYLSYVIITGLVAWIFERIAMLVVGIAKIPNPKILEVIPASTLVAIVIAGIAGLIFFSREKVNTFSLEVLQELKKVTWPAKKAAYMSTIVVIVVVVIVSVILGFYDWAMNYLVGLLLKA